MVNRFNLRKYSQYSQTEEWYNVFTTDDQDILRKILERGNDDAVSQLAAQNKNCPTDVLKMVLERGKDDGVSRYAAQHVKCPTDVLKMVLERGKDDFVSRYASRNENCPLDAVIKWKMKIGLIKTESPEHKIQYVNLQKDDSDLKKLKGLIANKKFNLRKYSQTEEWYTTQIARTTTDRDILRKILEKGNDDAVSQLAALNKNCPSDVLRMVLERGKAKNVSGYAAKHINCPPELLKMVLERGNDDWVSRYAAENINCPIDALRMVLERGKDDYVSWNASQNPNCPKDAVIKWKLKTGKIQTESQEHKIQYVNPQKDDSDLKKLKSLIANKQFNLRKYSQTEEWYTEKIARITTDQDILRNILEKGNNDRISLYAAINKNCPPDALKMVLKRRNNDDVSQLAVQNVKCPPDALRMVLERGKDDVVSQYAARNKNCPPDALKMVLERGKDDGVSRYAAQHENCPPDVLKMVLERGKDDGVSWYVAHNKNCPAVDSIKWKLKFGHIQTESPEHKIQYVNPQKDYSDLLKLQELIK